MPDINPPVPIVGQPDSTEEPKIVTALTQLIGAVNNVDSDQIADLAVATADLADGAVTTNKLGANAVTAAKIEPQQAWQSLTLAGGSGTMKYYKDSLGHVWFRSDANQLSTGSGWSAFMTLGTMPVGFRPVTQPGGAQSFMILVGGNPYSRILVDSTGVISAVTAAGSGQAVECWGNIHYRAEN